MEKRRDSGLAAIAMLVLLLIVAASLISIFASRPAQAGTAAEPAPLSGYWTEDSVPAQKLRDYVAKVTDPNDTANYIPEKDRIAVFDMDGMLTCETYYTYYDTFKQKIIRPSELKRVIRKLLMHFRPIIGSLLHKK